MAALVTRRVRTVQPQSNIQIDWNNPLTQGLVFAYTCGSEAQGWGEDGRNGIPYAVASTGAPTGRTINTPSGQGGQLLSNTSGYLFGSPVQTSVKSGVYSLFAFGTGPASGMQSALDDDDGTTRRFQFRLNAGKVELIPFYSGGNGDIIAPAALSAVDLAAGFAMGATVNGTAAAVYQKGVKTAATLGGAALAPNASIMVGARKTGTSQCWLVGGLMLIAMWNRPLTDAEHTSLAAEPWQLFKPAPRRLYLAWSATSGTTIAATTAAVSVQGLGASVLAVTNIAVGVAAVSVAGLAASIVTSTNIACGVGVVSVQGQGAQIVMPTVISGGVAGVAVTGLPAQIVTPVVISCATGVVVAAGLPASISSGNGISCTTAAVTVQGLPVSITAGAAINCATGSVTVQGQRAGIAAATTIACGMASVSVAGLAATIVVPTDVSARAATVVVGGQAAQIVTTEGVVCTTARVTVQGLQAEVSGGVQSLIPNPHRTYVAQRRTRVHVGQKRVRTL